MNIPFIVLLINNIIIIIILCVLIDRLDEWTKEIMQKETKSSQRVHSKIKTSNYNTSYGKRGYEQFKNEKTGLYEPQKPHQGIELKNKKEE